MDIANVHPEFYSLINKSIQSTVGADKTQMLNRMEVGNDLRLRRMRPSTGLAEEKVDPRVSYLRNAIKIEFLTTKPICILGFLKGVDAIIGKQLLPWNLAIPFGCCFSLMWSTLTLYNILRKPGRTYEYTSLSMDRVVGVYNRNVDHINKCFTYISKNPENKQFNGLLLHYACQIAELFESVDISYIDYFVQSIEEQVEKALLPDSEPNHIKSDLDPLSIFPENVEDRERQDVLFNGIKRAFCLTYRISKHCTKENKEINPLHKKYERIVDKTWVQALPVALFFVSAFILPYHALTIACSILVFLVMAKQNQQVQANEHTYLNAVALDRMVSSYQFSEGENPTPYHRYLFSSRASLKETLSVAIPSETNDYHKCTTM